MRFLARIKKGSAVDRLWRGRRSLGGVLDGVRFELSGSFATGLYVSGELDGVAVSAAQHNPSVRLEALGFVPSAPPAEPESDPDPEREAPQRRNGGKQPRGR